MKNFKYILIFILCGFVIPSCVDDTAPEDAYGTSPNLASFASTSMNLSGVANGNEYEFNVPVKVKGPSVGAIGGPVTATVSVDPSSTAIEGVHFRLESTTVTFDPSNDYLNLLPVTMLSDGVVAPLAEAPKLVLRVSDVSGSDKVIANGKTITLNLLYLCFSNLAGTYDVHVEYYRPGLIGTYDFTDEIVQTADGEYRTGRVGHWTAAELGGTPGFSFVDVCNEITIPEQNLVDLYSNLVEGTSGTYDPDTETMSLEYTICATDCRRYVATYVRQ